MLPTLLAYLDPGSGSVLLQALAGGLAAAGVVLKLYWRRVLEVLRVRRREDPEPSSDAG